MKKILIIPFLFTFAISICAQEAGNFSIDNGGLIWQKVIETDLGFDELTNKIKEAGFLENIEIADDKLIGRSRLVDIDYTGAGFRRMQVPIYIASNFVDFFALMEFREGRYRVTVRNITLIGKSDSGLIKEGERTSIETYAVGGDEIKNAFSKRPSEAMDYTFTKLFTIAHNSGDDEW